MDEVESIASEVEAGLAAFQGFDAAASGCVEDRERTEAELRRLSAAAQALRGAAAGLGAAARSRLVEAGGLGSAALAALESIAADAHEAAARTTGGDLDRSAAEPPDQRLMRALFEIWERRAGGPPTRDLRGEGAFARLVSFTFALVAVDADRAHALRIHVHELRALTESAGLLELIPDE